jgi:NAD(P)-dependent dehydrogenase (short-subunit alcohol dehydrogenase family)
VELKGRAVLLTGASGGIGRATALLLTRAGARLALFARSEKPLRDLASAVVAAGGEAIAVPGDVRVAADGVRAVAETTARFGGLDALVNNAGLAYLRGVEEASDAEIEEQIGTNLMGTCRMTRAALPALRTRPGSAIVNVSSYAGRVGAPYYSFYNASKFGLIGLSEAWRRELGPLGIRVSTVIPMAVETSFLDKAGRARALGMGPAGTVIAPDRVARGIVKALRRHPAEIYLPGWSRWLAIVNSTFPAVSDRVVTALFRYPPRA